MSTMMPENSVIQEKVVKVLPSLSALKFFLATALPPFLALFLLHSLHCKSDEFLAFHLVHTLQSFAITT